MQLRQNFFNTVDGGHNVRPGLTADIKIDPRHTAEVSGVTRVRHRIQHFGNIAQAHWRIIAKRNHQLAILLCREQLTIGTNSPATGFVRQAAVGPIHIRGAYGRTHLIQA